MNKEFYRFICETLDNVIGTKGTYVNQADLTSYGINSLSYIKILVAIEDKYGLEFDDEYLALDMSMN